MLELLARWGCDTAQGYLIGKPMPASAFEQWLRQWQGSPLAKVF
jgi:EAL domain-containing protein (putative c-di-GMP-specific phosphodiesterase class I)